eukprot:COSAG05_NODE_665_length_8009_cov_156.415929_5_plen_232_part_00
MGGQIKRHNTKQTITEALLAAKARAFEAQAAGGDDDDDGGATATDSSTVVSAASTVRMSGKSYRAQVCVWQQEHRLAGWLDVPLPRVFVSFLVSWAVSVCLTHSFCSATKQPTRPCRPVYVVGIRPVLWAVALNSPVVRLLSRRQPLPLARVAVFCAQCLMAPACGAAPFHGQYPRAWGSSIRRAQSWFVSSPQSGRKIVGQAWNMYCRLLPCDLILSSTQRHPSGKASRS